jgi:hypothetical protein
MSLPSPWIAASQMAALLVMVASLCLDQSPMRQNTHLKRLAIPQRCWAQVAMKQYFPWVSLAFSPLTHIPLPEACDRPSQAAGYNSVGNRRYRQLGPSSYCAVLCCAVGFTRPLTEMNTTSRKITFLGSRVRPVCRADNLTSICEPTVWTMWDPQHLTTIHGSKACYGDSFIFLNYFVSIVIRLWAG